MRVSGDSASKGYQEMISDLNAAEEASQTKPWKDILVSWDPLHFKTDFGILAGMLLPALDKAQSKAVRSQVEITLTQTSIDLERYYLRQGHYPERLENLVPDWRDSVPVDPMTGASLLQVALTRHGIRALQRRTQWRRRRGPLPDKNPPGMALVKPMTFSSSTFRSAKACPNTNLATARGSLPCA